MRRGIYYTLFLVLLYASESLAAIINPLGFQAGAGAGDENLPLLPPGDGVEITRQASRTYGVAPLSVFFNADLSPSSPTERSFHDHEYSWNFGDSTSGNWGTNGKPKNTDKGAVAAHVYETPGNYTATLTVRDASGIIGTDTFTVTVTDPDVVFSSTNTTCISDTANNDFTGCPAGATQVATNDLSNMPSWTQSGERLLFHRGSSWISPGGAYGAYPASTETVRIGAYGTCTTPDANGICNNAPLITLTGDSSFITLYKNPDWVIADLTFTGTTDVTGPISGTIGLEKLLMLRIKTTGFGTGLGWGHWRTETSTHPLDMAIVSCDIRNAGVYVTYVGGENFALLGNQFHNSDTSHVTRVWWAHLGVINHNEFTGSSLTNTAGRQALKLHGPKADTQVGDFSVTGSAGLPYPTNYVIVANNIFGGSGPWPVSIGPQDDGADERLSDIIFEKNTLLADYGRLNPVLWIQPLNIKGNYFTVKNNVIDASYDTEDPGGLTAIYLGHNGTTPPPVGNRIYNNTIYCDGNEVQNGLKGINITSTATDTVIKNNYVSFPDETHTKVLIIDDSGNAIASHNVITDTPGFADARNSSFKDRDFSLTSLATEAIDQGDTVPVLDDYSGETRLESFDVGADTY